MIRIPYMVQDIVILFRANRQCKKCSFYYRPHPGNSQGNGTSPSLSLRRRVTRFLPSSKITDLQKRKTERTAQDNERQVSVPGLWVVLRIRLEIGKLGDYFFFSQVKSDEKSRRCQEQGNKRFANVLHLKLPSNCYSIPGKSQLFLLFPVSRTGTDGKPAENGGQSDEPGQDTSLCSFSPF